MSSNPLLSAPRQTPVSDLAAIHARLNKTFLSGKTRDIEYRKVQLRKLYYSIKDNSQRIIAALKADLNKPTTEAIMAEVSWLEKDLMTTLDKLDSWAKDEAADVDLLHKLMSPRIRKDPLGTVLVIG